MLILSRFRDQAVTINVPPSNKTTIIEVIISDIRGDKIRLGFVAERKVIISRNELVGKPKKYSDQDYDNLGSNEDLTPTPDPHIPMRKNNG